MNLIRVVLFAGAAASLYAADAARAQAPIHPAQPNTSYRPVGATIYASRWGRSPASPRPPAVGFD